MLSRIAAVFVANHRYSSTEKNPRRKHLRISRATLSAILIALCGAFPCCTAAAESAAYPERVVRLIVPQGAGGMVDTVSRAVAQNLSERLGRPVVVENRPGASEAIGAETAAKSAPDGHTIFIGTQVGLVLNTLLRKKLPYDPLRDFEPISMLFTAPLYLVVHPSLPVHSVQQLVALAKSRPGQLTYASIGVGTSSHLATELLRSKTKIDIVHVPYKSTPQSMTDLLTGEVSIMFNAASVLPHVASGKLRALASVGTKRTSATPNLPTMSEAGVPGFDRPSWYSLVAPAGVPRPIIDRLNREVGDILKASATRDKFAPYGIEFTPSTPEELAKRMRSDLPYWTKIVREAGIQPE